VGSKSAAVGVGLDDDHCALRWEVLWKEVCILEWVLSHPSREISTDSGFIGWAKYMEWMYPVEVRFTNKAAFRAAGAVEAAATL
jgi:hypothetical protein